MIPVSCNSEAASTDSFMLPLCRISNPGDSTLDEMMKCMYQDPDILEEKCKVQGYDGSAKSRSLR